MADAGLKRGYVKVKGLHLTHCKHFVMKLFHKTGVHMNQPESATGINCKHQFKAVIV